MRREGLGKSDPDCATCERPDLMAANFSAWELLAAAGPALVDGWGAVQLGNVQAVAQALGIAWDGELLAKILAVWAELREDS